MDIGRLVQKSLDSWGVPGAAVAVIERGELKYLAGHGVADFWTRDPVTPDTIFSIASCTKAFATTAAALLVSEGRLSWDDRVRHYVPEFRLRDPLADAEITVRDLACHRTGLGQHDLLWRLAPWDFSETIRRLAHLDLDAPLRSQYLYSNLMYIVLGCVVSAAAGQSWDDVVRQRLFEPLAMTRSRMTRAEVDLLNDVSTGHRRVRGQMEKYPDEAESTLVRASGSIRSCARDLGRWLKFLLASGHAPDGTEVVPAHVLAETMTAQMTHAPLPELVTHAGTCLGAYGLGWHLQDYRGQFLVEHTGGLAGFRAFLGLLPRQQCAVAVVANLRRCNMAIALGRTLLDVLLQGPVSDWDAIYQDQLRRRPRATSIPASPAPATHLTRSTADYEGRFEEPGYGRVTINADSQQVLWLSWSSFRIPIVPQDDSYFVAREVDWLHENPLHDEPVRFLFDASGTVTQIEFLRRTFLRVSP